HHVDPAIGVYIIDRFTYFLLEFLEKVKPTSKNTLGELFNVCPPSKCISTVGTRTDLFPRDIKMVLITDFFGSVRNVELNTSTISLVKPNKPLKDTTRVKKSASMKFASQIPKHYKADKKKNENKTRLSPQFVVAFGIFMAVSLSASVSIIKI
ncbi:GPI-anchor transamidase-like, partial [Saccoglossus kowalevskii]|uniref:GPI-anchor transamidase-like n=1 Tax=Saccoglossus kowalevskii TaxID=10224 RepID=A0ABM0LUM2_SACKO